MLPYWNNRSWMTPKPESRWVVSCHIHHQDSFMAPRATIRSNLTCHSSLYCLNKPIPGGRLSSWALFMQAFLVGVVVVVSAWNGLSMSQQSRGNTWVIVCELFSTELAWDSKFYSVEIIENFPSILPADLHFPLSKSLALPLRAASSICSYWPGAKNSVLLLNWIGQKISVL